MLRVNVVETAEKKTVFAPNTVSRQYLIRNEEDIKNILDINASVRVSLGLSFTAKGQFMEKEISTKKSIVFHYYLRHIHKAVTLDPSTIRLKKGYFAGGWNKVRKHR